MLPDLRAAIAAIVAAIGLLMAGFGVAATFRVAQESRPSPLQAARSALLTEPAVRLEDLRAAVARDETPPAGVEDAKPDETASIAPAAAPAPSVAVSAEPAIAPPAATPPIVAAEEAPPPAVADTPPAAPDTQPAVVVAAVPAAAAPPDPPRDVPETTGTVADVPHADAPVSAMPAPPSAAPVGGPLQQAALTPTDTPDLKPVVKKKPRAARKRQRDEKKARARAAAKRAVAARARRAAATPKPQAPTQQPWTGFNQPGFNQ